MTESIDSDRTRNTAEHVYLGRTRQNTGRGRYLAVSAIALLTLFWLLVSCYAISPAAAQSPTVTPWPGPAATATAAANQQAQAAAQRQQADALQQQANAARAQAEASYASAAQAASDARAALAAQQAGVAGEAIGRAEASINEGKAQLSKLSNAADQLRGIINTQYGSIVSMTIELQQARADKETIANAYNAAIATQETSDRNSTLLVIMEMLGAVVIVGIMLSAIIHRIRHRTMRADDGGAVSEANIVEQE